MCYCERVTRNDFITLALTRYDVTEDGFVYRTTVPIGRYPETTAVKTWERSGYLFVSLCADRIKRTVQVHRLVAQKYHGVSDLTVNHKDGNRQNNHKDNLEYMTVSENSLDAWARRRLATGVECKNGHYYTGRNCLQKGCK